MLRPRPQGSGKLLLKETRQEMHKGLVVTCGQLELSSYRHKLCIFICFWL